MINPTETRLAVIATLAITLIFSLADGDNSAHVFAQEKESISVVVEKRDRIDLFTISNHGEKPVHEIKLKSPMGNVKFVKAKEWERARIDEATVTLRTEDQPLRADASVIVLLVSDNSVYEWTAFGKSNHILAKGITNTDIIRETSLDDFNYQVREYTLPNAGSFPLYPLYDSKRNVLWISDFNKPVIWKFSIDTTEFESVSHAGKSSVRLALDDKGTIWFTDSRTGAFGYLNPDTNASELIEPPVEGFIIDLKTDIDGNVWLAILDKSMIMKFVPSKENFETFELDDLRPGALLVSDSKRVWFSLIGTGGIAFLSPETQEIKQFLPADGKLVSPASLLRSSDSDIWIGEHGGTTISKFDIDNERFSRYELPETGALVLGIAEDEYGNLWYAEHVTENIGVLDPSDGRTRLVHIPTGAPLTQWLTIDSDNVIWFTEPSNAKIGSISATIE